MITIVIANIIDFIAAMIQVASGTVKNRRRILLFQILQIGLQTVSMTLLGAIPGAISNVLSCIRNYLCYKDIFTLPVKILLILLSGILTALFNNQGLLGWLPFAVCTFYVIFMDIKDPVKFKILVTLTFIPWIPYHLFIKSYTGAFFAFATVLTNCFTLFQMKKGLHNPDSQV